MAQSGHGSNGNYGVFHLLKTSRTGASLLDADLISYLIYSKTLIGFFIPDSVMSIKVLLLPTSYQKKYPLKPKRKSYLVSKINDTEINGVIYFIYGIYKLTNIYIYTIAHI